MNSNDIRSQINEALAHEEQTKTFSGLFAEHLKKIGVFLTPVQQKEYLNFMKTYIFETPDIVDAVFGAANQVGMLNEVTPIFAAAFKYWEKQDDYIPDTLGLLGLIDDAYLTRMYMEAVSFLYAMRTGKTLLSIDLATPNRTIRKLIGEPTATTLDTEVVQTTLGQIVPGGLQQLGSLGSLLGSFGALNQNMFDLPSAHTSEEEVVLGLAERGVVF